MTYNFSSWIPANRLAELRAAIRQQCDDSAAAEALARLRAQRGGFYLCNVLKDHPDAQRAFGQLIGK